MDILLGLQWGDEGKGKIVDVLAPKYDVVARFQGGPNAGHTLKFDDKKFVLHQIPSGIFQSHAVNVIGNGVVLDICILKNEIEKVESAGFQVKEQLQISKKAHLILPTHRLLDAAYEEHKGDKKIGSTLKGIGPTYQDKIGRLGLRIGDIIEDDFKERYDMVVEKHKSILAYYNYEYNLEELETAFFEALPYIKGLHLVDSEYEVNEYLQEGKKVLAEGAQGSLLDIDFGSYPYVTSSNTFSAGASTGLGVPPNRFNEVYGIFKAYCTRVGSGPFPTELFDADGEKLQNIGHEFGATTGRRRRCGWLDLPALKYAAMLNGVTQLFMMKADVLNTFEEIKVCTHYQLEDGSTTDRLPFDLDRKGIKPVYKTFKGWNCEVSQSTKFENLPEELLAYVNYIEEYLKVPISIISIGPDRTQTIRK